MRNLSAVMITEEQPSSSLLQKFLEYEHYEVASAASGDEALRRIHERPGRVVLLGIDSAGKEALRLFDRRNKLTDAFIVVMVAAIDEQRDRREFAAVDFFVRPFDFQYLRKILQEIHMPVGMVS